MARIVVTGAAGSLGRKVVAALRADHDVVAIDRVPPDGAAAAIGGWHVTDLAAAGGDVAAAFRGAEVVVHLAWAASEPGDGNARALGAVLAAAADAGVGQVVHLSSATVYGAWPDNKVPLDEDALLRPNPGFAYAAGKAEAERLVRSWAARHEGVALCVLRPVVTLGGDAQPLYDALGATRVPGLGDGARPVQFVHIDDLAAAVVTCVERRASGTFNVAPDAGLPDRTARALAGGLATVSLPGRVVRPVTDLGWRLWRRGVPSEVRPYALHPWVVAPDRLRALGWEPGHSSEEALVATDTRRHLEDLPPGRRQQVALLASVGAVATGGVAAAAALTVLRRRARRRGA